jgi:P-type Ca2+ transporter type 2C
MHRSVPLDRLAGLLPSERGLSAAEVEDRRHRYGANDIVPRVESGWRATLADTGKDPMLWFLAATSVLFAAVGQRTEALIMLGAVAPIAGMDAFLHRRTRASTQGLASRLAEQAVVIREAGRVTVSASEVVPGDLAIVSAGEPFPADGLIVGGRAPQADESVLTGEAFPVRKDELRERLADGEEAHVDARHWGFAGTRLLTGEVAIRIVHTGADTLYGEIVRSAASGAHSRTPLQQALGRLVAGLLTAAAVLCVILAWVRWHQGHGLVDALVSAVTLGVAALPEEFPIVFTFFLGVGVFRLARRQALVRRAVVVENIGRVSSICSDKTGTITEGRIVVTHREPATNTRPERLTLLAALASRGEVGDPLDTAILSSAGGEPSGFERIATFPFTEDRRRETGVFRTPAGDILVACKGAPETILPLCRLSETEQRSYQDRVRQLAAGAHKVIACAWQERPTAPPLDAEPSGEYEFAGLLACEDPVRQGAAEAILEARQAGIRVIMVTGDHPATAAAVAREVGIGGAAPRVIEGDQIEDAVRSARLAGTPLAVDVIARAVPAEKLELVRALQAQGEIVAVTGDGVNDVPALQAADIGIAMGERGTRSAREVSAVVLLDDNFRTIVSAIAEGRQLFRNLRLSFAYLLMIHIPLVVTATVIPLAGYPLLYLPIHVVWLELIIHPTALLVFQELPTDSRLRGMDPNAGRRQFFSVREWFAVGAIGAIITLATLWGFVRSLGVDPSVEHARTVALATLVIASATLTASLSALRTWTARAVPTGALASVVLLAQVPVLAHTLHLEPLHYDDWLLAAVGGIVPGLAAALLRWRPAVQPPQRGGLAPS